jgi:hypothetical protein
MPMREDLIQRHQVRGEARLEQAIASNVVSNISGGGALDVNVTEQALDARGQILIKGAAELVWQHFTNLMTASRRSDQCDAR